MSRVSNLREPGRLGTLEVICGPMFSGKTETLIRRLRSATLEEARTIALKPTVDGRFPDGTIGTHGGSEWPAMSVSSTSAIAECGLAFDVVGIDEAQFFDLGLPDAMARLSRAGVSVVVAGLDNDFRGRPFDPMPQALSIADQVVRLTAVCAVCGGEAGFSQRLINGSPAPAASATVLIGATDLYEPRCARCFVGYGD